jgi:soluble lytic murein transglycosylase-like protein
MLSKIHSPTHRALRATLLVATLFASHQATANAQSAKKPNPISTPIAVPCVEEAAAFHGVSSMLLRAIIFHESRGNASIVLRNTNGSVDVGLGGLNSIHFPELARYGIAPNHLLDGCVNTYVAAWHLAKQVKAYGNTWFAVGTYHSKTPEHRDRYAGQIYAVLQRWKAVP